MSADWKGKNFTTQLGCAEEELFWRAQQNLSTGFNQSALFLPLADQAAGGEMSDVGRLRQLFVCDIQLHAFSDFVTNALGQVDEDGGQPLRSCVAGERHMRGNIEGEVLRGHVQCIFK